MTKRSSTLQYSLTVVLAIWAAMILPTFVFAKDTPQVTYLSDLTPVHSESNYSENSDPVKMNQSVRGGALSVDGVHYDKGIGTGWASRIDFKLDRSYDYFASVVGIDDDANYDGGSVTFEVWDNTKNIKLWDSGYMGNEIVTGPLYCQVPIKGVTELSLRTTDILWNPRFLDLMPDQTPESVAADDMKGKVGWWDTYGDREDWANARLVIGKPVADPLPKAGFLPNKDGSPYQIPAPRAGIPYSPPAGTGIERFMNLLATSTKKHRNTVRLLFYGQSHTRSYWWYDVVGYLQRTYPYANIVVENRAHSGAFADVLVKNVQNGQTQPWAYTDIHEFDPDLIIMHDYGNQNHYPELLKIMKSASRPETELLILNDFLDGDHQQWNFTDLPTLLKANSDGYNNGKSIGFIDARSVWEDYIAKHGFTGSELIGGDGHLNTTGSQVLAKIVEAYMIPTKK